MAKDLEFRRLQRDDKEGLCDLFYETLNDRKGTDYWEWKYYQNPAGEHMTMVGLDGSRVVGNVGAIPVDMKAATNTLLASQGVDTAIRSDHRTRTTFFRLESGVKQLMAERGVYFTYAFSIKETYRIFTGVLGFKGVCPMFNMSKVINPSPYLDQRVGRSWLSKPLGLAGKEVIARFSKKKLSVPAGLEIVEVTEFDTRFDSFWHQQAEMFEVAVIRDSKYLNWRYIHRPTMSYKIFCVETEGDRAIKGFIVLGCYQQEVARGRILDILVESGEEEVTNLLLTKATNYFIDEKMDVIMCWMLEHWPIFETLKKKGFVQRETNHDLMVRSYVSNPGNEYLADRTRWYVTMGDSDYF